MKNNSYALVTGGTSGIGYELALLIAKDGYNLIIVARNEAELADASSRIKDESGVEVITIAKDLFDRRNAFDLYHDINPWVLM